jgi:Flp pilus assembly protein TadG
MIRRMIHAVLQLRRDHRGVTIVEFALVVPVMLLLFMGLMEICYQGYVGSVLSGAVRKAGRDAGIQGGQQNWSAIDKAVMAQVNLVAKTAVIVTSTHQSYASFTNVAVPEPFSDTNGNGKYDSASECFTDINGNGVWDTDQGVGGSQGGASDVAVYTLTIQYPRLFPLARMMGWSANEVLSSTTILKNQPYTTQAANSPLTCCPGTGCS